VVAVAGKGAKAIADAKYLSAIAKKTYLITTDEITADGITTVSGSVTGLNGSPLEEIEVVKTDGEKLTLKVDGLFVAVGLNPVTALLAGQVERDGDGFIVTDEDCETSEKGIFAVGDIRVKKVRQIVTAAADGAIAAAAAIKRIKEN
jgi:thioredoxin reductase (NADPH)